jgi:uncharacterized protein with PQ loop repeat
MSKSSENILLFALFVLLIAISLMFGSQVPQITDADYEAKATPYMIAALVPMMLAGFVMCVFLYRNSR